MIKKAIISIVAVVFINITSYGQNIEVLYFKANLGCCAARFCDALERHVREAVEKNYSSDKVAFKTVLISAEDNAELIKKHNAKSQTVILVAKKRRKEVVTDISNIVREFSRNRNNADFESKLIEQINGLL